MQDAGAIAGSLIAATGASGVELGRRFLAGPSVPMPLKLAAAKALTEAGIFAPGHPIPVLHQGRSTSILVKQMEIRHQDPELDQVVAEAIRLRDAGRKDEAYQLLSDLQLQGIAYPPAMGNLANLMRERGELEAAQGLLESLERLAPDDPAVLFNLAGFWLQKGNLEQARQYVQRIDPAGSSPEFRQRLAELEAHLRNLDLITELSDTDDLADGFRENLDQGPISPDIMLKAALKRMPVQWLNAAATLHKLAPVRRRPDRERALAAALQDPIRLRAVLAAEEPPVRAALGFLMERGGWCKLQVLCRRYGSQDGDGFWWDERPPNSPVGRLRALGLVHVGQARVDGKAHKIAVVPGDLHGPLTAAL